MGSLGKQAVVLLATVGRLAAGAAQAVSARTVWLCRPAIKPDPCTPGLSTTVYSPSLQRLGVRHPRPVRPLAIDCFYVYPTVGDQQTEHANLHVDPEERSVAL
jgi:hypothetical protein